MRLGGSDEVLNLVVYQEFGGFCYGDGWIWLSSSCQRAEQFVGDLMYLEVSFYSSRVVCVKGGILCFKNTVMLYPV
jgi:hypothetical protein